MKKLVLIDSNALVHRAFHALPPTLTSPKGVLTNAVYGFTSVLIKMIKDLKPDYIAATYDLAGPTFRHEEFAEYKAHREKAPDELYAQIPLTKEVLKAFGIPIYEKQGFEADDVLRAGLIARSEKHGTFFDRFRNRVMFPIMNHNGKTVAFTGRILPEFEAAEQAGKYVNSPESPIFSKSRILYGYDKS